MVIFGGLEIVAAGYLLNEFNKDKVEARERRKQDRPYNEGKPHFRPPRPDSHGPNNLVLPDNPPRPLSAPPQNTVPDFWQKIEQRPQQQQALPQYQQQPQNWGPRPQWQPGPQPQLPVNHQPPPPGPGALQHPNTFHGQQQPSPQPFLQSSNTFPVRPSQQPRPSTAPVPPPPQPFQPMPQGHVYIDSKTGKISHNLYPPDHPMARGMSHDDRVAASELYGGEKYARTMAGDLNTGLKWVEKDGNDLAYGKDYSNRRRWRRDTSYERRRERMPSSSPPRY